MEGLNPYLLKRKKDIIYSVYQTSDGWNLHVSLPPKTPTSDRLTILEWVRDYRRQIRQSHPLWSVVFHPSAQDYWLEIRKTNNDRELIEVGE